MTSWVLNERRLLMRRGNTMLEERTMLGDSGGRRSEYHLVFPDGSSRKVNRKEGERIVEAIGQEKMF